MINHGVCDHSVRNISFWTTKLDTLSGRMGKYTKTFPQTFAEFHHKYGDVDDIYLEGNKLRVPKRAGIPPGAPSGITTGAFSNKADSEENNFECNESSGAVKTQNTAN